MILRKIKFNFLKIFIILGIFISIYFIFYTNDGLKTAVEVLHTINPNLSITNIQGTLISPIKIDYLSYNNQQMNFAAHNIQLQWNPFALLLFKLKIDKLHAQNITLKMPQNQEKEKPKPQKPPSLPIALQLNNIALENITIIQDKTKSTVINNLNLNLQTTKTGINSINLNLVAQNNYLQFKGDFVHELAANWNIQLNNLNTLSPNMHGSLHSIGRIAKDKKDLTINIDTKGDNLRIGETSIANLQSNIMYATKQNPTFSFKIDQLIFPKGSISTLNLSGNLAETENTLQLNLNPTTIPITTELQTNSITIQKFTFDVDRNAQATYIGQLKTGPGTLNFSGTTNLKKVNLLTTINIDGTDFQIVNSPSLKIYVTPKLKLALTRKRIDITGSILIPKASINPEDLSSVVTLPDDVIINGGKTKKPKKVFNVYVNVILTLGKDIYLDFQGLKGYLTGELTIKDQPKTTTTAIGTINIEKGVYDAYGQHLQISSGKLVFTGGPITNPFLDVRAIRTITDTPAAVIYYQRSYTVGVHLQGPLSKPTPTLFSEPANLSQADILSLLITGIPSSQLDKNQATLLLQATTALGFGNGNAIAHLTDSLKDKFNLTELGFESKVSLGDNPNTKGVLANTSFVLGKYLSPRLYLSYGFRLADQVNTLKLRYSLGRYFALQSETSAISNSIDLLYGIEK